MTTRIRSLGLACTLCCAALSAQKWRLPERGVAFYQRDAELVPMNEKFPHLPGVAGFSEWWVPPVVLQGEFDATQKHLTNPPAHLQDVAMWLAFDLRRWGKRGRVQWSIPFMFPFGMLRIEGSTSSVDEDGIQTILAEITRHPPERGSEPKEVYVGHYLASGKGAFTASVEIDRKYDTDKDVVTWFRSEMKGKSRKKDFSFVEEWKLDRTAANRYPGFTSRVAAAIQKGAEHIRQKLRDPDGPRGFSTAVKDARTVQSGRLALCLLTLLKADIKRNDEIVERGFDSLRRRVIKGAYSCGSALMAMEALYAPPNERQLFVEGRIKEPLPRTPTPEDRKLMQEWVNELLSYTDTRIRNKAYLRRFNYVAGNPRYDNSVTQYAVLGLYSAYLCGIEISPTTWFAIANHELADQHREKGIRAPLALVSHREYERKRKLARKKNTRTVVGKRMVEAWGWPYQGPISGNQRLRTPLTGSMTVAGISDLTICSAVLRSGKRGGELISDMDKAVRRGFAWVLHNFSVRHNPHRRGHYFYYLYGLERAAELAQVALIGDRDWYFEGATMLIEMQQENGAFARGIVDNCFAVLFLKQAAPPLPAITGR